MDQRDPRSQASGSGRAPAHASATLHPPHQQREQRRPASRHPVRRRTRRIAAAAAAAILSPCSTPSLRAPAAELDAAPISTSLPSCVQRHAGVAQALAAVACRCPSATATVLVTSLAFDVRAVDRHHQPLVFGQLRRPPRRSPSPARRRTSARMRSITQSGRKNRKVGDQQQRRPRTSCSARGTSRIVAAANSSEATVPPTHTSTTSTHEPHADQQQLRVEDEDEGQHRGAQRCTRCACHAGRDWGRRPRSPPRRYDGQAHRRRHVGHDAEVEDEQVHRDQRDHQPAARTELHDHRRHQRGHQDVVGRGRHAQAPISRQMKAVSSSITSTLPPETELDEVGHHQAQAGERDARRR